MTNLNVDTYKFQKCREKLAPYKGPWCSEPDKAQWLSDDGLLCFMNRNYSGVWCGYVALKPDHPLYFTHYNDLPDDLMRPHGGVTFSDLQFSNEGDEKGYGVYWVGRSSERLWVLGFDCHHLGDYSPKEADENCRWSSEEKYRDYTYAFIETTRFADSLAWYLKPLWQRAARMAEWEAWRQYRNLERKVASTSNRKKVRLAKKVASDFLTSLRLTK